MDFVLLLFPGDQMAPFGKKGREEGEKPGNHSCETGFLFSVKALLFPARNEIIFIA